QILELSHAPDFWRVPELIGVVAIILLVWGARKGRLLWRDPLPLLALSMALVPFVVFNQRLITGRSLQPFHYEGFITNYVALVGLFLTLVIFWRGGRTHAEWQAPKLAMIFLACAAFGWGWLEVDSITRMPH